MKTLAVIALSLGLVSASASAHEVWDCTFPPVAGPPGPHGHVSIQIDGANLDLLNDPYDVPQPKPLPAIHIDPGANHYDIIENNDVGIVAVAAQARLNIAVGPVVNSSTIAISRADGAIRGGVVGTNGL